MTSAEMAPNGQTRTLREAAREAHAIRSISGQTPWESLPYLLEECGELAKALRHDATVEQIAEEVADIAIILDHILDRISGGSATLDDVAAIKVLADRWRFSERGSAETQYVVPAGDWQWGWTLPRPDDVPSACSSRESAEHSVKQSGGRLWRRTVHVGPWLPVDAEGGAS